MSMHRPSARLLFRLNLVFFVSFSRMRGRSGGVATELVPARAPTADWATPCGDATRQAMPVTFCSETDHLPPPIQKTKNQRLAQANLVSCCYFSQTPPCDRNIYSYPSTPNGISLQALPVPSKSHINPKAKLRLHQHLLFVASAALPRSGT